jgi:diguanylate cyclase (GGDEF)-like protein
MHFNKVLHNVTIDRLTGAYNRQHFLRLAEVEFTRSKRYGHPLSVIAIDIEYVRPSKSTYSNQIAAQVLKAAARHCLENIRGIDLFGRYNDNLLLILLPETGEDAATLVSRRLKERITGDTFETNRGPVQGITTVRVAHNRQQDFKKVEEMVEFAVRPLLETAPKTETIPVGTELK